MYSPTLDEFLTFAAQGNLIPVTRRILADLETPLSAYRKIRGAGESFLFESVEGGEHLGRYSFVGCNPRAVIKQTGSRIEVIENGKVVESFIVASSSQPSPPVGEKVAKPDEGESVRDGLEVVERIMKKYRAVAVPGLPRFTGGAVGFIGYEFIHDVEPAVPRPAHDELKTPVMYFLIADELLIFDRVQQTITILVNAILDDAESPAEAYENATSEIDRIISLLEQPSEHQPISVPKEIPPVAFESNQTKEKFFTNVEAAKKFITAGDIIQVVGSQRFSASVTASPLDIYRAVRNVNPSPYLFLLELDGFALVGASPELHVRCEEGKVEIRPIAGTRRRGKNEDEDAALEKELLADPKERAEHVMLVDLARNDIGRVCDFGSVQVKDLMFIERYSHVMHIVSQVEGKLSAGENELRSDARNVSRRYGQRRAENPCDADHLPAGTDHARHLCGRGRLLFLQRQSRHLHHHPHRAHQGWQGLRPGRWRLGERFHARRRISGDHQ